MYALNIDVNVAGLHGPWAGWSILYSINNVDLVYLFIESSRLVTPMKRASHHGDTACVSSLARCASEADTQAQSPLAQSTEKDISVVYPWAVSRDEIATSV